MSTEFQPFYQDIASRYEDTRYQTRYGRLHRLLHYRTLAELLVETPREAVVFEVACGTGHTTRLLANLGFKHVACDLTPEMMAAGQLQEHDTQYFQADALSLPVQDNCCDLVVSTRFLHLFPIQQQKLVLQEMARVLKPGGTLLVDFDNLYARWLYVIPHLLYNLLRYQRLAPYSIYNAAGRTHRILEETGLQVNSIQGVGGWHLILPALVSEKWAISLGWLHRGRPLRWLAEQFVVRAIKP